MSTQDNIVKVEYNGRKYNVNVSVENDLSIDLKDPELDENKADILAAQTGIPLYPPPAAPADKDYESVQGSESENQNGVPDERRGMLGGRKPRRTNRRGPGRPRKTRRYRRRSIRK
jgi:hypothetical protein